MAIGKVYVYAIVAAGAVVGVGYFVYKNWQQLTAPFRALGALAEDYYEFSGDVIGAAGDAAADVADAIGDVADTVVSVHKDVADVVVNVAEDAADAASGIIDFATGLITGGGAKEEVVTREIVVDYSNVIPVQVIAREPSPSYSIRSRLYSVKKDESGFYILVSSKRVGLRDYWANPYGGISQSMLTGADWGPDVTSREQAVTKYGVSVADTLFGPAPTTTTVRSLPKGGGMVDWSEY